MGSSASEGLGHLSYAYDFIRPLRLPRKWVFREIAIQLDIPNIAFERWALRREWE